MRDHLARYVHKQVVDYIAIFSCESPLFDCIRDKNPQEQLLLGPVEDRNVTPHILWLLLLNPFFDRSPIFDRIEICSLCRNLNLQLPLPMYSQKSVRSQDFEI